jgi:hypothetical protein
MRLRYNITACKTVFTLERESILEQNGLRVTCLALPLAAAQSLGSRVLEDSQSHLHLTIAIRNK